MPYDKETGKHYDYTDEGIEQYKKDTGKGMPMKNMAYWKNKNTLPGLDPMSDENLPDGRSLSAPFQYRSPVKGTGTGGTHEDHHDLKDPHREKENIPRRKGSEEKELVDPLQVKEGRGQTSSIGKDLKDPGA